MPEFADLTPTGLAGQVAGFLETLDLRGVTVVGNETGGAIAQLLATEYPDRVQTRRWPWSTTATPSIPSTSHPGSQTSLANS